MCAHTNVSISVKNRNNEILKPYEWLCSHRILHIIVILSTPNRAIRRKWETSNASTSNAMFFFTSISFAIHLHVKINQNEKPKMEIFGYESDDEWFLFECLKFIRSRHMIE